MVFSLRSDPLDSPASNGHLSQEVPWVFASMAELMGEHLKTLAEFPPRKRGRAQSAV